MLLEKSPAQKRAGDFVDQYIFVLDLRLGDIDLEFVAGQIIVIEHADRLVCFGLIGHGDKSETLREAAAFVHDEIDGSDGSRGGEQGIDFCLRGGLGQVSYIDSNIHFDTAFSGSAGIKKMTATYKRVGGRRTTEIQLLLIQCSTHIAGRRGNTGKGEMMN